MKKKSIFELRHSVFGLFLAASWMPATELQFSDTTSFETRDGRIVTRYSDVAEVDGKVVELEVEVLGQTPLDARNRLATDNGGLVFELEGGHDETRVAKVNYRFYESGTTNPVVLEAVGLRLKGLVGRADQLCTLQTAEAVGFSLAENSNLVVDESNGILVTPNSNQDPNAPAEANEVVLDFGNCHSFTINYGCDFLTADAAFIEHHGTAGSNASPPAPAAGGSTAIGDAATETPVMPLYYTYRFNNRSAVPIEVELADVLPEGVPWDKAFLPTQEGTLVFDVVYDSDRKARIPGLMLPPGQSRITLATQPVPFKGEVTNSAYISFTDGTEIAPMNGNPTIDLGSLAGKITSNPFLTAYSRADALQFGAFVTGTAFEMYGNSSAVAGDVGVSEGVTFDLQAGSITGELSIHPPVTGGIMNVDTLPGPGGEQVVPVEQNLYGAEFVITELAKDAADLPPTEIIGVINSSTTISSSEPGAFNVVLIDGVDLGGSNKITLVGGESDFFVLNVKGNWWTGSRSGLFLSGGVLPKNVVINFLPSASGIVMSVGGQATIEANVFACEDGQRVELLGGTIVGSVIADELEIGGGSIAK